MEMCDGCVSGAVWIVLGTSLGLHMEWPTCGRACTWIDRCEVPMCLRDVERIPLWWDRVTLFPIWLLYAKRGECGGTLRLERG